MKNWYSIKAVAADAAEISIYDEIGGWGVTAKEFIDELKQQKGKQVTCCINSPGGSVFDALAMYNALRAHGSPITMKIMGVAASAASLVAMAGDEIIMPENSFMMVHNPLVFAYGNAVELRDMADTLDTIASSLVKTYVARTNLSEEEVKALLAEETWLTAEDAVAKGFADKMEPALKVAASFETGRLPANIKAIFEAATTTITETETETKTCEKTTVIETNDPNGPAMPPEDQPQDSVAQQVVATVSAAGFEKYAALVACHKDVPDVTAAQRWIAQAKEVTALCAVAKKPDMADKFIQSFTSVQDVRAALFEALASESDAMTTRNEVRNQSSKQPCSGAAVWAKILPTAAQKAKE